MRQTILIKPKQVKLLKDLTKKLSGAQLEYIKNDNPEMYQQILIFLKRVERNDVETSYSLVYANKLIKYLYSPHGGKKFP